MKIRGRVLPAAVIATAFVMAAAYVWTSTMSPTSPTSPPPTVGNANTRSQAALDPRRPDTDAVLSDVAKPGTSEAIEIEFDRARDALAQAKADYADARAAVSAAEYLIAQSETDVEALERFIEELEARGEDPADHAEEGMELFTPAFEAYERASLKLQLAENDESIERIKLHGAERRFEMAAGRLALESSQ